MASVGTPVIHDKYREVLEKQIARMLHDMDDEASWNFHSEKAGVKGYTRIEEGLTAARGVGHIPVNPRAVWHAIMDVGSRKSYDAQLNYGKRLEVLDAQTVVDQLEYNGMLFVSGRDFVTVVHWRVLPDDTIIVVAQSTEHEAAPVKDKVVRGEVGIAGWRLVPDADYKGCQVTYMVKTDLKGSIPARIAGKAAGDQPYLISELTKVLQKDKDLARFDALGKVVNTGAAEKAAEATSEATSDAA